MESKAICPKCKQPKGYLCNRIMWWNKFTTKFGSIRTYIICNNCKYSEYCSLLNLEDTYKMIDRWI